VRKWESLILSKRSETAVLYYCFSISNYLPSFVIRNALQWVKSPVGQPGDTALAAYVVRIHVSCA
jgi:hypothetical protein